MRSSQAVALLSVLILSTGCAATSSRHSAPEGSKSSRFDCDQSADLPGSCFASLAAPETDDSLI